MIFTINEFYVVKRVSGVLRGVPLSSRERKRGFKGERGNPSLMGFPLSPLKKKNIYKELFMKKRFSLKNKLMIVFGLLILVACLTLGILAVRKARKAVTEKVEVHLIDKATDVANIIDGRINIFFQFLEGIARTPILRDNSLSYQEKTAYLTKEAAFNDRIKELDITDKNGNFYYEGGSVNVSDREWFQKALSGRKFFTEPYIEKATGTLVMTFAVPVLDSTHTVVGVLSADINGLQLSEDISDIVVGKTGYCYILGLSGTTIAHKNFELVTSQDNIFNNAKTNRDLTSLATFTQHALEIDKSEVGYYNYKGNSYIGSNATMKTTDWTVIIRAPVNEFMGTVNTLRASLLAIGVVILVVALVIVFFVAQAMVKPIGVTVEALKNIAQGEGDLTVRLPIHGNDEITDLSNYFNETIAKIGSSIKSVGKSSNIMQSIGDELSSNMTETASAINEITANIDGVKQQTMNQAASVTETSSTVEEIIRTIEQLNGSIETQAASVTQSSASIEEMVANIASITQSLEKSDNMVKMLSTATSEGKSTLITSNTVTQKIADEIRKLAEESSVQGKTITDTLKNLSDDIRGLAESSKIVEEKFNAIFQLAENVRGMSAELTAAMREQENGSREVLAAIKNINSVTVEVKSGSEEMLIGGKGVAKEMQKLDSLTAVIKDSMNEMSAGVSQINNAVNEVNELAMKNKQSIEGLAGEVGKFKV